LRQKEFSLYEDFSKGTSEESESKSFTASKGWLHRFRNRYELKNIKSTGMVAFAVTNAATIFVAYLKELIERNRPLTEMSTRNPSWG
jgi:hypothetical protein